MRFADTVIRTDSEPATITRWISRSAGVALLAIGAALCAPGALAADRDVPSNANARYQSERAACVNGASHQDRATCLQEAGAALDEAKRRQLNDGQAPYDQNAMNRCKALPGDDRLACEQRIQGSGVTKGSVAEGGVIRELTVPDNSARGGTTPESRGSSTPSGTTSQGVDAK
jgi:hypothetical protein